MVLVWRLEPRCALVHSSMPRVKETPPFSKTGEICESEIIEFAIWLTFHSNDGNWWHPSEIWPRHILVGFVATYTRVWGKRQMFASTLRPGLLSHKERGQNNVDRKKLDFLVWDWTTLLLYENGNINNEPCLFLDNLWEKHRQPRSPHHLVFHSSWWWQ